MRVEQIGADGTHKVLRTCTHCTTPFLQYPSKAKLGFRPFCSATCQLAFRNKHGTAVPSDASMPDGLDENGVEWRTIPSFPTYQASATGVIRRSRLGASNACKLGKIISQKWCRRRTYRLATLTSPSDGIARTVGVHRLVCEAFHGTASSCDLQTAHWDGDGANNTPANLRWATAQENADDRMRHGTVCRGPRPHVIYKRGERAGNVKFTDEQVLAIRAAYPTMSQEKIAKRFGTSQSHVGRIVRRELWSHI